MNPSGPPPLPESATLLRIYLGESDKWEHRPLYEAIVLKARECGIAGATVFRSPLGFGASSHLHNAKILQLSTDLPLVIEIVDHPEAIERFLPQVEPMLGGGMITLQEVRVLHYRAGRGGESPATS